MTNKPNTDLADADDPESAETEADTRRWVHCHVFFVLAVLTGYRWRIYEDREQYSDEVGEGIESWNQDDQVLAIAEGRRQLDAQFAQLQYLTRRAAALLPVGIAASAFFLTQLEDLSDITQPRQTIARILLVSGSTLAIWGALVMGALIGGRATFKQTDALQLTKEPSGLRKYLARDYAENVSTGVNTNAARLTHLGTGVTCIAIGALLGVIGLAVSVWSPPPSACDAAPANAPTCVDIDQNTRGD
ncbi:MAG: hypothetical protein F4X12_20510 [Acidobacteriia bacterium]|nr:hypothetical protein [Terriglobia bacterium]